MNRHGDPEQGYDHEYAMKYTVSDDVQDRAREAAIKRCMADCYDVPLEKSQLANECKNAALSMIAALTAAELRIVDADADDRRTEALAVLREFVAFTDRIDCMGEFESSEFWLISDAQCRAAWREKRDALAPYLHDDDSGKTYTTESEG